jgi:hypothetical protein
MKPLARNFPARTIVPWVLAVLCTIALLAVCAFATAA